MKLTVSPDKGILLDGHPVERCTKVEIKNISPGEYMEVVLHVDVTEADIQWKAKEKILTRTMR